MSKYWQSKMLTYNVIHMHSFALFWLAALFSNSLSGVFATIVQWSTSGLQLPSTIVLLGQISGTLGFLFGVIAAMTIGRKWQAIKAVCISTFLEVSACLPALIIGCIYRSNKLDVGAASILAVTTALFAFASGIGGPSWITLVYNWDNSGAGTSRVHWDSVQFNIGRMLGPMMGAVLLIKLNAPLMVSAALNLLSFSLILVIMMFRLRQNQNIPTESRDNIKKIPGQSRGKNQVNTPMLLLALFSIALLCEGSRGYLARWLQISGESSNTYAFVSFAIAFCGALAGIWMAHNNVSFGPPVALGLILCVLAFTAWIWAVLWSALWVLGGALAGMGGGLTYGAISIQLMIGRSEDQARYISSVQLAVRSLGSVVGAGVPAGILEGTTREYWMLYCAIMAAGVMPLWVRSMKNFGDRFKNKIKSYSA